MKDQKSDIIFNLCNNFITIGNQRPTGEDTAESRKATESLNHNENILTGEFMNELLHLPADTVLIPFLKRLSIPTAARNCNDILHTGVWDLKTGYLRPQITVHQRSASVQPDVTVILKDCVVLFELKNPRPTPSRNLHAIQDLGRQTLLCYKLMNDYGVNNYRIILGSNIAPRIHIKHEGAVDPADVIRRYFTNREDKWLEADFVQALATRVHMDTVGEGFIVRSWIDLFSHAEETIQGAEKQYDDPNIQKLMQNALASLAWFRQRRQPYFNQYPRQQPL